MADSVVTAWEQDQPRLEALIRAVPDFPRPGILFRDLTPMLRDASALRATIAALTVAAAARRAELVVAPEARGFLFGAPLAAELGAGFVPARKPGKLPRQTVDVSYTLEYGLDVLQIHADAIEPGTRVLIHDDLLATGGTAGALCELVQGLGGQVVGLSFVLELTGLNGRERLDPYPVSSLFRLPA